MHQNTRECFAVTSFFTRVDGKVSRKKCNNICVSAETIPIPKEQIAKRHSSSIQKMSIQGKSKMATDAGNVKNQVIASSVPS